MYTNLCSVFRVRIYPIEKILKLLSLTNSSFICLSLSAWYTAEFLSHCSLGAAQLKLFSCHNIDVIRVDRVHPPVCYWVEGPDYSVTGVTLRKVKSWETDGMLANAHTNTHAHIRTYSPSHTLLTLPKGQWSIVQLRWASLQPVTHTHTHTTTWSEYSQADVR